MTCNGCGGKGWVETGCGVYVHICPICKGTGDVPCETSASITHWVSPPYGKKEEGEG